jgi:hypothetical protein
MIWGVFAYVWNRQDDQEEIIVNAESLETRGPLWKTAPGGVYIERPSEDRSSAVSSKAGSRTWRTAPGGVH